MVVKLILDDTNQDLKEYKMSLSVYAKQLFRLI